jgi:hypothetical protein
MVRLNKDSIVIEIESKMPCASDVHNLQISIINAIQYLDPEHNPLGLFINPVYHLLELLKATLPDVEDYPRVYKPEDCFQVPFSVSLSEPQRQLLRNAILGLNGVTPTGRSKEILEILKQADENQ